MRLKDRFQLLRPLEEMELALVRACMKEPTLLTPVEEGHLRYALSMARLYRVRHGAKEIGLGTSVAAFRAQLKTRLGFLLEKKPVTKAQLHRLLPAIREDTLRTRDELAKRFRTRVPFEAIDQEIRHKALVIAAGGGGGTGYLYVGALALLEEYGLRPKLLVGTSMGAILCLFRARTAHFDVADPINIVRQLSWKKLFRAISYESRYGIPAALRLFLRAGIGRYFSAGPDSEDAGLRLKDLAIPTYVTLAGIRRGMLPHPPDFYEGLLGANPRAWLDPRKLARGMASAVGALAELIMRPEIMVPIHVGSDSSTLEFDALDAAGFSSALPGVIHYDVLRDDPRMHGLLGAMLDKHRVGRLADGGLVDNVPAQTAWQSVHRGDIGTRNAFVLALNGFSTKLSTPVWLPLQRLAEINVSRNRPYAHWMKDFRKTLSPLEVVPSVERFTAAIGWGRSQLAPDMPFLTRMLAPLPAL